MLTRFISNLRIRPAAVLAVFYALCVTLPSVAMAFGDPTRAANCLTQDHHYMKVHAQPTVHADAGHKHHDHGMAAQNEDTSAPLKDSNPGENKSATCCGLFCFSAIATLTEFSLHQPLGTIAITLSSDLNLAGRGPERLIRPPIALSSL